MKKPFHLTANLYYLQHTQQLTCTQILCCMLFMILTIVVFMHCIYCIPSVLAQATVYFRPVLFTILSL